jgi:hypothetical protein
VEPGRAIVVEDAISGVEAGRAGEFGLVVGVARNGAAGLREAGADAVVRDLREPTRQMAWGPATREAAGRLARRTPPSGPGVAAPR